MLASGACTKLSKPVILGSLKTGRFRNGTTKTRRSPYGVYWAESGQSAFKKANDDADIRPERLDYGFC